MKCPFCNENLPEGSMFCSNCGTRVDNASGSGGAKGGGVNEVPLYQIPEPAPAMMPERKKGKAAKSLTWPRSSFRWRTSGTG